MKNLLLISICVFLTHNFYGQTVSSKTGNWYNYFYMYQPEDSNFGLQGDVQSRNYNLLGDFEQLMLRSGVTYSPEKSNIIFTLGYAYIPTESYSEPTNYSKEHRIYQEALIPQSIFEKVQLTHRFRYEQRFVEGNEFNTRFRYNLFVNIPVFSSDFSPKSTYLALYNEIFINGSKNAANNQNDFFDRNRAYAALGYVISEKLKVQFGYMRQISNSLNKGQLQISLHHNI